jgi:hypothetical protein
MRHKAKQHAARRKQILNCQKPCTDAQHRTAAVRQHRCTDQNILGDRQQRQRVEKALQSDKNHHIVQ